ncbi:E3 SUMO-protein ligase ZBED1-like [Tachysurus ichikawai]
MSGVALTLAKKRARAAGFGTNANANKYLNQDYEAIRSQCKSQGQLFCDPCFPAAPESLGFKELGPNSSKVRGVQWKRPGQSGVCLNNSGLLECEAEELHRGHWIEEETLERKSVALACKRLRGRHTFDILASSLDDIHSQYHIRDKIVRTTTDSGSNFLKAFRVFGVQEETAADHETDDDTENEEEAEYQNMFSILEADTGLEYHLLNHQRCACHLLNLVATADASVAETQNATYRKLSRSAFSKCHALWNKSARSSTAADVVDAECHLQFIRPNQTQMVFAIPGCRKGVPYNERSRLKTTPTWDVCFRLCSS